jgi:monoamine oxidase
MSEQTYTCDCAIIGGGVSGTYAGWRLLTDAGSTLRGKEVAIFEMSDRIGGRLMSWLPFGEGSGFRGELGGMRFPREHQTVYNLAGEQGLNLNIVPFYTVEKGAIEDPALDHALLYLRGAYTKYLPTKTMNPQTDPVAQRYKLDETEKKFPSDLVMHVITEIVNASELPDHLVSPPLPHEGEPWESWDRKTWDEVKHRLSWEGRPLWKWGFWDLLTTVLQTCEAYQYLSDWMGYYTLMRNWNAAEALSCLALDIAARPKHYTLKEGFGHLPKTLAKKFTQEQHGKIFLHHQLVKFEQLEQEGFLLSFRRTSEPNGAAINEPFYQTVHAKQIILAIPQWALQKLEPSRVFNLQDNTRLKEVINSVLGQPAFKLFLLYDKRWWEEQDSGWDGPIHHGHSVCDLPIRQTYYFRPDICDDLNAPDVPYKNYGLLMVCYDDGPAVDYWRGMEEGPDRVKQNRSDLQRELQHLLMLSGMPSFFTGLLNDGIEGGETIPEFSIPPHFRKAPVAIIDRAIAQVELLHRKAPHSTPRPLIGVYADWSLEPYRGGWNFWRPQFEAVEIMKKMAEQGPLPGIDNVYVVGEAYSGLQGWVEGALSQTEVVLENHFGLNTPRWLPTNYYIGPGLLPQHLPTPPETRQPAMT